MITAEWVGGPYDGTLIALDSDILRLAIARGLSARYDEPNPSSSSPSFQTIIVYPELTRRGWVVRWPKGAS